MIYSMNGEATFRTQKPSWSKKVDKDPQVSSKTRKAFWRAVNSWTAAPPSILEHFEKCCGDYQFRGSKITLKKNEQLGRAGTPENLARNISLQASMRPARFRISKRVAESTLNRILHDADRVRALSQFHKAFGPFRLASLSWKGRRGRIYAFRSRKSPLAPISPPLNVLLKALALPSGSSLPHMMLAFRTTKGDDIRCPTCFDAGGSLLDIFKPGGRTAGGVPEVVMTPPFCRQVAYPPTLVVP